MDNPLSRGQHRRLELILVAELKLLPTPVQSDCVVLVHGNRIMKTNEELFDFLEELVKELINSNEKDAHAAADRIRLAAGISLVGTEVLMALRKELTDLMYSNIGVKGTTCNKLREAISGINTELAR